MNYPNDNSTTPSPALIGRIYNGLDARVAWPVIMTPYILPTGTFVPKKSWWRKLLGL